MRALSQSIALRLVPNGNTRALGVLVAFGVMQIADAWLTTVGIDRFGIGAEANPMLALPIALFGPVTALAMAKSVAVCGAALLYRFSRHFLLAMLTVMYMFVAVMPWALALSAA